MKNKNFFDDYDQDQNDDLDENDSSMSDDDNDDDDLDENDMDDENDMEDESNMPDESDMDDDDYLNDNGVNDNDQDDEDDQDDNHEDHVYQDHEDLMQFDFDTINLGDQNQDEDEDDAENENEDEDEDEYNSNQMNFPQNTYNMNYQQKTMNINQQPQKVNLQPQKTIQSNQQPQKTLVENQTKAVFNHSNPPIKPQQNNPQQIKGKVQNKVEQVKPITNKNTVINNEIKQKSEIKFEDIFKANKKQVPLQQEWMGPILQPQKMCDQVMKLSCDLLESRENWYMQVFKPKIAPFINHTNIYFIEMLIQQDFGYSCPKSWLLRLVILHAISVFCKVRVWDYLENKYDDPEQQYICSLKKVRDLEEFPKDLLEPLELMLRHLLDQYKPGYFWESYNRWGNHWGNR